MIDNKVVITNSLRRTFDQLPTPFFIREKNTTRFIYANMALAKLVGLKSPDAMINRIDDEIPASLFDNPDAAKLWQEQVKKITKTQSKVSLLEVHPGAVDYPYISKKFPFYNNNDECVAMAGSIRYLEVFSPNDFIRGRLPGSLLLSKPDDTFTEKSAR